MGLRSKFLQVVLRDLPETSSRIEDNTPRWDALLGGKRAAGKWARFEYGFGTTCGVIVDGWLLDAGAPPELINAAGPGGSGFTPGAHITRLNEGAKALGWLHTPEHGQLPDLRPGYIYEINHTTTNGTDGTHVGVVVRATPSADGRSLEVETADGGQGSHDHQYVGRRVRTFHIGTGNHPVTVSTPGVGDGWLDRWIVLGGDEEDSSERVTLPDIDTGAGTGPGGATGTEKHDGIGFALGLVGIGLLLSGLGWYVYELPKPVFSLATYDWPELYRKSSNRPRRITHV